MEKKLKDLFKEECERLRMTEAKSVELAVKETREYLTQFCSEICKTNVDYLAIRKSISNDQTELIKYEDSSKVIKKHSGLVDNYKNGDGTLFVLINDDHFIKAIKRFSLSNEMSEIAKALMAEGLSIGFSDDGNNTFLIVKVKYFN